jgi:hypothetical protein
VVCGYAIQFRRGMDDYDIPIPGLTQLETTAINLMLGSGREKIL